MNQIFSENVDKLSKLQILSLNGRLLLFQKVGFDGQRCTLDWKTKSTSWSSISGTLDYHGATVNIEQFGTNEPPVIYFRSLNIKANF